MQARRCAALPRFRDITVHAWSEDSVHTAIGEINAGFNNCVLSSFRALIYICCLKIVVFAHDYMLHIGTHTFPHTLTEVQLLKCLCAFATPFSAAYLPTLARSSAVKVVVYL